MPIIADLHIHSRYSRATSKNLRPEALNVWAQRKGIRLLGTGDFTHPGWLEELEAKLEPAEEGLFKLKPGPHDVPPDRLPNLPPSCEGPVRFVFQTEISTIYKKNGFTRKVHHLVLFPDFSSVHRFNARLDRIGNLRSDGRPILGLDSRALLETALESSDEALFIPAHVWTPWFSVFGSKSGFDDIEECYEDLTSHITALETGLSSDPPMNRRWSGLDRFFLVSNSDAHSPSKLGREANILDIPLSYAALKNALTTGSGLLGTIEFFPEEGKYHLDGHRKCNACLEPSETRRLGGCCPVCKSPLTVGVLHRVEDLCDRPDGCEPPEAARPYESLVGLDEILGEILHCGPQTKRVQSRIELLLERWGPELAILREVPTDEFEEAGVPLLSKALERIRSGNVILTAGFDGQFGRVRVFSDDEIRALEGQKSLWPESFNRPSETKRTISTPSIPNDLPSVRNGRKDEESSSISGSESPPSPPNLLTDSQKTAIEFPWERPLMILAGPGTGKTRTLTERIAHLVRGNAVRPEEVLAATFTQKAALEMADRLMMLLDQEEGAGRISVMTLHAFGYGLLRDHGKALFGEKCEFPALIDEQESRSLLKQIVKEFNPSFSRSETDKHISRVLLAKKTFTGDGGENAVDPDIESVLDVYDGRLRESGAMDFEDLIRLPVRLLDERDDIRRLVNDTKRFLFVDEYQDLNPIQVRFLKALYRPDTGHVTAIGDPDQSIYGFRGASVRHFFDFSVDFPGASVLRLHDNFRSTRTIVESASCVIEKNPLPFPRILNPTKDTGPEIRFHEFPGDKPEAVFVAHEINRVIGGTSHFSMHRSDRPVSAFSDRISFGDIAVLYRVHALARLLEETLSHEGIPYQRFGGGPKSNAAGVCRIVLSALRWILAPFGENGENEARRLFESALAESDAVGGNSPEALLSDLADCKKAAFSRDVSETVGTLLSVLGIEPPVPSSTWDPDRDLLERLLASAASWTDDIESFYIRWNLLEEESDMYDPRADRVSLMSVHGSKGLEFQVVFVVGCEDHLFPYDREADLVDIEEERRLFFVAMTRACDLLYLTRARSRHIRGERKNTIPSRFLGDVPDACLLRTSPPVSSERSPKQLKLF